MSRVELILAMLFCAHAYAKLKSNQEKKKEKKMKKESQ